jgi:hypothetical protein
MIRNVRHGARDDTYCGALSQSTTSAVTRLIVLAFTVYGLQGFKRSKHALSHGYGTWTDQLARR